MVFVKVTDGIEARRFQVSPGEITFQQLQERINAHFPGAVKDVSTLALQYRDNEGDLITLSSDEEFQEVLSDFPSDNVLKLYIFTPAQSKEEPTKPRHHEGTAMEHLSTPGSRRDPWAGFHRQLKETEELLELLLGLGDKKSSSSEQKKASQEKTGPAASEQKTTTLTENTAAAEEQGSSEPRETTPKKGDEEEVKSKHPKKASSSERPTGHRCCCQLWEPSLLGMFGPSPISSSVRYHVIFTPRSQASAASCA